MFDANVGTENVEICKAKFTPVERLVTIIPNNETSIIYLYYSVKNLKFDINGAGQAQLTVPNVVNKVILIPPLSLQQSFAKKVEAIETKKTLISQSLKETEELFNSRMDYYFN